MPQAKSKDGGNNEATADAAGRDPRPGVRSRSRARADGGRQARATWDVWRAAAEVGRYISELRRCWETAWRGSADRARRPDGALQGGRLSGPREENSDEDRCDLPPRVDDQTDRLGCSDDVGRRWQAEPSGAGFGLFTGNGGCPGRRREARPEQRQGCAGAGAAETTNDRAGSDAPHGWASLRPVRQRPGASGLPRGAYWRPQRHLGAVHHQAVEAAARAPAGRGVGI